MAPGNFEGLCAGAARPSLPRPRRARCRRAGGPLRTRSDPRRHRRQRALRRPSRRSRSRSGSGHRSSPADRRAGRSRRGRRGRRAASASSTPVIVEPRSDAGRVRPPPPAPPSPRRRETSRAKLRRALRPPPPRAPSRRSPSRSGTTDCVSGSPNRQLNSSTRGPSGREHQTPRRAGRRTAYRAAGARPARVGERARAARRQHRSRARGPVRTSPCLRCSAPRLPRRPA